MAFDESAPLRQRWRSSCRIEGQTGRDAGAGASQACHGKLEPVWANVRFFEWVRAGENEGLLLLLLLLCTLSALGRKTKAVSSCCCTPMPHAASVISD